MEEYYPILALIRFDFPNKFNIFNIHNLILMWWFSFFINFSHGNGWDNLMTC